VAVVAFFNAGGTIGRRYPGSNEIHAVGLTALNQSDLVAFMQPLVGPGAAAEYLQSP